MFHGQMGDIGSLQRVLDLPRGLLPVGSAWNTSTERHPGGLSTKEGICAHTTSADCFQLKKQQFISNIELGCLWCFQHHFGFCWLWFLFIYLFFIQVLFILMSVLIFCCNPLIQFYYSVSRHVTWLSSYQYSLRFDLWLLWYAQLFFCWI